MGILKFAIIAVYFSLPAYAVDADIYDVSQVNDKFNSLSGSTIEMI
ncbi:MULTISPECIES: hypothetical protein [Clostridium]|uniref:Uncharacterized protein n=1 Tax=Clostridium frigoriphilum TaxID=443253 RepID=A0ABU7USE3_9CLOT|nr:hypothetical protein [Clostridium sp. DSM 17811]MBU3101569.1 hypothetical protein [Clostridium sp. DSM 17811]